VFVGEASCFCAAPRIAPMVRDDTVSSIRCAFPGAYTFFHTMHRHANWTVTLTLKRLRNRERPSCVIILV
jgi:hypothetical protein